MILKPEDLLSEKTSITLRMIKDVPVYKTLVMAVLILYMQIWRLFIGILEHESFHRQFLKIISVIERVFFCSLYDRMKEKWRQ